jgi:hypothetical protein
VPFQVDLALFARWADFEIQGNPHRYNLDLVDKGTLLPEFLSHGTKWQIYL